MGWRNKPRFSLGLCTALLCAITTGCLTKPASSGMHSPILITPSSGVPANLDVKITAADPPFRAEFVSHAPNNIDFIPTYVNNQPQALTFNPNPPRVTWQVQLASGQKGLAIQSVKLSFTVTRENETFTPPPNDTLPSGFFDTPPPNFSPPPGAPSFAPPPTPNFSALPDIVTPVDVASPAPIDSTLTPSALGWPSVLVPGTPTNLIYDFQRPEAIAFFKAHPQAVQIQVDFELLDTLGRPVQNVLGQPLDLNVLMRVL